MVKDGKLNDILTSSATHAKGAVTKDTYDIHAASTVISLQDKLHLRKITRLANYYVKVDLH